MMSIAQPRLPREPATVAAGVPGPCPWQTTTTLYELCAALHTLVAPDEDAVVVAILTSWIRRGQLRWPRRPSAPSHGT